MPLPYKFKNSLKLIAKKGKELDRFKKFVHFHKEQRAVGEVFDFLMQHYDTNFQDVTDEKVLEIFATNKKEGSKVDKSFLRVYYSNLNDLIEQFLIQEQLKKDLVLQQQLLAKAYDGKGKFERFEECHKEAIILLEKEFEAKEITKKTYLFKKVELTDSSFFHHSKKGQSRNESELLTEASYALDRAYVLQKLKFSLELFHQSMVYKQAFKDPFLRTILTHCTTITKEEDIEIYLYSEVVKLYLNETTYSLSVFCEGLTSTVLEKNPSAQQQLFSHIQNNITQRINAGGQEAFQDAFEWFKFGIVSKLLLQDGKLSETMFLNIANTAAICCDFEWFEHFLEEKKSFLQSSNPAIIINLCKANEQLIRYEQSKNIAFLNASIALNENIKCNNLFQKLTFYILKIKQNFHLLKENRKEEEVQNSMLALESFIAREKSLSDQKRDFYLLFPRYLRKIIDCNELANTYKMKTAYQQQKAELTEEINKLDVLPNKHWMLHQLV